MMRVYLILTNGRNPELPRQAIDRTGQVFGKLKVLLREENNGRWVMWSCVCECGNVHKVRSTHLTNGAVKSCGCINKEKGENSGRTFLLAEYRCGARDRGLMWDLTIEEFSTLTSSNCVYCGIEPRYEKITKHNKTYKYNGIDRIDSNIGYVTTNVVSCCGICNRGKSNMDNRAWEEHLNQLVKYRLGKVGSE